ncbi:hypothetical protein C4573_02350 [Candidatus Woesearchaeota archaeon]|nr:MAG: hypothetical protein C4573_02350 [Candidatus Woesearchaeota archaeon]
MKKTFLCSIGIHAWNKPVFLDSGIHSSVRDYRQVCKKCGKRVTWVQPKNLDVRFYPKYWGHRLNWLSILLILLAIVIIIVLIKG